MLYPHVAKRRPDAGHRRDVWYDTQLERWVARIPRGPATSCILPLEIRWFDAPPARVRAAAAELMAGA